EVDRVGVVVAHHELLAALQLSQGLECRLAEADIAEHPDRVDLGHGSVPPLNQIRIVLLDALVLRPGVVDDVAVAQMKIRGEVSARHGILGGCRRLPEWLSWLRRSALPGSATRR